MSKDMDKSQLETQKRLGQVETDVKLISHDIKNIRDNHLSHMQKDIDKIDLRLWAILFMIVALAITNVLATWLS
tara:strand:- start:3407 stop:3628 length:222 start_codon:yes stop_codon:yes gene_type:complete